MGKGHLDQGMVREDAGDLPAERLIHPVVVVGVEEAALLEVAAQVAKLFVGEMDVAVPRHIDVRHVPQLVAGEGHDALAVGDAQRGALPQRGEQVRKRGGIRVPVAAAVVVEAADGERSVGQSDSRTVGQHHRHPDHA